MIALSLTRTTPVETIHVYDVATGALAWTK
jgi:hypothetical protein